MICNKSKYETKEEAEESCRYAILNGWIPNERYLAYECKECFKWHFGKDTNHDVGFKMKPRRSNKGKRSKGLL